ncbi:hypothetical protein AWN76_008810 [Rhodothermaceae bacterium RA]|nr:hypothetical protein AWN76_008810 [Rhodothermaceae bacterium RA]
MPVRLTAGRGGRAVRVVAGVGVLGGLTAALAAGLRGLAVPLPASVVAMLLVWAGLLGLEWWRPPLARGWAAALDPAVGFLGRWMALFFVPPLVMLPQAPAPQAGELGRVALLVGLGLLVTLSTTGWLAQVLARRRADAGPVPPREAAPRGRPPGRVAVCWGAVALGAVPGAWAGLRPASVLLWLGVTVAAFAAGAWLQARLGARLPAGLGAFGRRAAVSLFHPVLFGALVTLGALRLADAPLPAYRTGDLLHPGAGDLLMALLDPAVAALGVLLYRQRALLRACAAPLLGTLAVAAPLALATAALGAGLLGLSADYARAVIPRSVTTPIAIPIAEMLGAHPGITAAIVVLTGVLGAVFGPPVLDALGVRGPVARGLAIGASAHGIGTAALVAEDPPAAAVSGVAFALMAALSALAVGLPPVRDLLLAWATGG